MRSAHLAVQRLQAQHLLKPDFDSPADVVRWFGAVQAQDYLGSLFAVALRMRGGTQAAVEDAIARKRILRTWPMRGTMHFVPPEDTRWMLNLLARRGLSSNAAMNRRLGLTEAVFARARKVVTKALQGGKLLTRNDVYDALEAGGIKPAHAQRGFHIVGYLARHALICFGPRQGKQPTFALLDEWIPAGRQPSRDEAIAELTERYFRSHGPATLQDFAWWSGLTLKDARAGLGAVHARLWSQTVGEQEYWSGFEPKSTTVRLPHACLLPAFDEFAVAYRDRSALLERAPFATTGLGLGPIVIVDGRMVGTWKRTLTKDPAVVEIDLFAPLNKKQKSSLASAALRYAEFLGRPVVVRAAKD